MVLQAHTVITKTNTDGGPGRGWGRELAANKQASLQAHYIPAPCFSADVSTQVNVRSRSTTLGLWASKRLLLQAPDLQETWEQQGAVSSLAQQAPRFSSPHPPWTALSRLAGLAVKA